MTRNPHDDRSSRGELTGRAHETPLGPGAPAADLSGRTVGRYTLVRQVGRGGMGAVYEARDARLDRAVAVKILPLAGSSDDAAERFKREARAAAALNHPNIVSLYDAGEQDGFAFLVMEFVTGSSLDRVPPASLAEALDIAAQICDALDHAHGRGIVHRDLKPGNVLIAHDGDRPVAKLTDLGIALARGAARVTRTGAVAGTPGYMAPEQALGQPVDRRADLYSLGVMLYEWTVGRLPFEGDDALTVVSQHINAPVVPPSTRRRDLPQGLEPVILALLAKTPWTRPATAAIVRDLLGRVGEAVGDAESPRTAISGLIRGRLVGRREELARLREIWRASLGGQCHLALVSGEPGVGKTRLALEVTALARLDGAIVLTGGCYENEATTPYLPFLEALRRFVGERDDDDLRELLGSSAREIARLAPEIEARLGPFPPSPELSPQEERLRLFDHVARFLRRLSEAGGLLVFLDDLQWADHGSLALLHYVLRQLTDARLAILGTYREIELDRAHPLSKQLVEWTRERLATRVRLDRFTPGDTRRLLGTLLCEEDVPRTLSDAVHAETEGNPFFIEEIVKAMIAGGHLVREDAGWTRAASSGELLLPQSVKAAIGSRLERVSDACCEVLRTAAVIGKAFGFTELAAVAQLPEETLLDALDEAVAAQLVTAGGGETFRFTHDKIREVLRDEMNVVRRRRVHARVAAGLEALHERGRTVAVEDLAHHAIESGDLEKGLVWAERAAAAAAKVFAYEEAVEMLTRARECAEALGRLDEVCRLDESLGDACVAHGDVRLATEHYERAIAATGDAPRLNVLRGKIGDAYVTFGDPRGLAHVEAALAGIDETAQPRELAIARMVEARYLHLSGRLREAADRYGVAIERAEAIGHPPTLVRLLSYKSGTLQHLAEFDASDDAARRSLAIGTEENVPLGVMLGYEFLSENAFYRGRSAACVEFGELEEVVARETHACDRLGWSLFRAFALHDLGRTGEAFELYDRALRLGERSGDTRLGYFVAGGRALLVAQTGKVTEGIDTGRALVEAVDAANLLAHRISLRGLLLQGLLLAGERDEAAEHARTAVRLWRESESLGLSLIYGAPVARALLLAGAPPEEINELLDAHEALATRTRAEHRLGENRHARGLVLRARGETAAALHALSHAAATFERLGSRLDFLKVLLDRKGTGDAARAAEIEAECGFALAASWPRP